MRKYWRAKGNRRETSEKKVKEMAEWKYLKYPHLTEKSIMLIERANTVVFVVGLKAKKPEIRAEFEKVFEVKVAKVNTEITSDGKKKAFIKLKPEFKASDVAVKLGVI